MNRLWPITVAFLSFIANGADLRLPSRGLEAMFTVTVTDENNAPVDDATIEASFVLFGERLKTITSKTDTHGMVVVTGRAIERVIFRVYGKGFYPSRMEFPLLKSPFEANRSSIDAGKWLPWNQAISIKLLRNEAAEYTQLRYASVMIPTYGKTYGMDLKEGVIFVVPTMRNGLCNAHRRFRPGHNNSFA